MENMSSQFYHLLASIELTLSIPFRNKISTKCKENTTLSRDHESFIILDFLQYMNAITEAKLLNGLELL